MTAPRKRPEQRHGAHTIPGPAAATPRRRLFPVVVLAVIGVALAMTILLTRPVPVTAQACTGTAATTGLSIGQCAPSFTLPSLQGQPVSLSSLHGHPVLLHFWAVGCTTCAAEYSDFSRIVREYRPKGLTVLAVDAWGEPASLVRQWQGMHHLPATILVDPPISAFALYHGQGTPTTYFIDHTGRIRASSAGPLSYVEFKRNIAAIL